MSTTSNTTVQSITLRPGEQFSLPPNSRLIATTDPTAISSTCGDVGDLPPLSCYAIVVITNDKDTGDSHPYDQDQIDAYGMSVNGKIYAFSSVINDPLTSSDSVKQLAIEMKKIAPGILTEINVGVCDQKSDRSIKTTFCFKSIPSFADNMYLILRPQWMGGLAFYKAVLLSEIQEDGCAPCSCSSNVVTYPPVVIPEAPAT